MRRRLTEMILYHPYPSPGCVWHTNRDVLSSPVPRTLYFAQTPGGTSHVCRCVDGMADMWVTLWRGSLSHGLGEYSPDLTVTGHDHEPLLHRLPGFVA